MKFCMMTGGGFYSNEFSIFNDQLSINYQCFKDQCAKIPFENCKLSIYSVMEKSTILLISIIFIGALLRAYYMLVPGHPATRLSPDEAVYGIEATHILKGERPVFFYAQPYTGATSAYISALLFAVFGISDIALKVVPFVFSLLIISLSFKLAEAIFKDSKMALTTAALTALGSPFWLNWSSRAGTGYIEMMVFGALIFLLTIKIVWSERKAETSSAATYFILGLISGFGFWVQPTIVYYLLPAAVLIFLSRPRNVLRKEPYAAVLGALIGASPVLYYNLTHQSATAISLFNKPWGIKPALYKFFAEGMPVILGTRPPWSTTDFFLPLAILVWLLYLAAFIYLFKKRYQNFLRFKFQPIDLILAFFPSLLFIFSLSSPFNQFVIEPRYIQALYTGLPLVVTWFAFEVEKKFRKAGVTILLVLLLNGALGVGKTPATYFVDGYTFNEVIPYLKEHNVTRVFSDAALAHRLTFFAKEQIVAAPMEGGVTSARIPYYESAVKETPCKERGVVVLKEALVRQQLVNEVINCKIPYEEKVFDDAILVVVPR